MSEPRLPKRTIAEQTTAASPPSSIDPESLLSSLSCPKPSAKVGAQVRRECTQALCTKRSLSRSTRMLLCGALLVVVIITLGLLSLRGSSVGVWRTALWGTLGWAVVLLAVLAIGVAPKRVHSPWWRRAVLLAVPAAFFAYLAFTGPGFPSLLGFLGSHATYAGAMKCGLVASLVGAVATAGVLYIWRGSDPFTPRLTGAMMGLIGGIAGALSVGLVCPGQDAWHLLFGHGLSVVALGLIGLLVGRRILSP